MVSSWVPMGTNSFFIPPNLHHQSRVFVYLLLVQYFLFVKNTQFFGLYTAKSLVTRVNIHYTGIRVVARVLMKDLYPMLLFFSCSAVFSDTMVFTLDPIKTNWSTYRRISGCACLYALYWCCSVILVHVKPDSSVPMLQDLC